MVSSSADPRFTDSMRRIIQQMGERARVRGLLALDEVCAPPLALWTLIRWERKIGLAALEEMGVDLHGLADRLDALITRLAEERPTVARGGVVVDARTGERILFDPAPALAPLLAQAAREARRLGHNYVGSEHLLLAIISSADSELAAILNNRLIAYDCTRATILELLG